MCGLWSPVELVVGVCMGYCLCVGVCIACMCMCMYCMYVYGILHVSVYGVFHAFKCCMCMTRHSFQGMLHLGVPRLRTITLQRTSAVRHRYMLHF